MTLISETIIKQAESMSLHEIESQYLAASTRANIIDELSERARQATGAGSETYGFLLEELQSAYDVVASWAQAKVNWYSHQAPQHIHRTVWCKRGDKVEFMTPNSLLSAIRHVALFDTTGTLRLSVADFELEKARRRKASTQ